MNSRINDYLKNLVHPFMFVLKEGDKYDENPLDYTLMMLQLSSPEVLTTSAKRGRIEPPPFWNPRR